MVDRVMANIDWTGGGDGKSRRQKAIFGKIVSNISISTWRVSVSALVAFFQTLYPSKEVNVRQKSMTRKCYLLQLSPNGSDFSLVLKRLLLHRIFEINVLETGSRPKRADQPIASDAGNRFLLQILSHCFKRIEEVGTHQNSTTTCRHILSMLYWTQYPIYSVRKRMMSTDYFFISLFILDLLRLQTDFELFARDTFTLELLFEFLFLPIRDL